MLDLALLEGLEAPLVVRSFAACLASAAEVPLQQVPLPDAALSEALGHPGDGRSVARLLLLPDVADWATPRRVATSLPEG